MSIKLYGIEESHAYRCTLLTVHALGLDVEFVEVNTLQGEQYKPEFLELNPLHTIPTIQDGDFVLWDSHAINIYLVDKYGKDDSLYPKDLEKRGVVDQRLYFHCGVLFPKLGAILGSLAKDKAKTVRKDLADALVGGYASLEILLEKSTYVAGEQITIADFSIAATLTTANLLVPMASNRFSKISEWLTKIQSLPYYASGNQAGLDKVALVLKGMLS